ncbi:MAG TPA: hypothetical protein VFR28_12195 [Allosphingosinicella sp.]|jgi:hypothetical protein|nr:hypothetical protein [Allosphingosinicella sp.]
MSTPRLLARLLLPLAAPAALLAVPASACSVQDDYRVPTNLELIADSEVIVMARVDSGSTEMKGLDSSITVTPIELLKGKLALDKPLVLAGSIAEPRFAVLSNPLQLEQAHPLAYIGACTRYIFVRGATVLFFLTPAEKAYGGEAPASLRGRLVPAGGPFSRWAEDVLSAESPWVRATRIYLKAAALPPERRKALLVAERNRLRALGDQESRLIADDIDRQLAGRNKRWNQLMEEELKKMEERGEDPLEGLAEGLNPSASPE